MTPAQRALLLALVLAPLAGCAARDGAAAPLDVALGDAGFRPSHQSIAVGGAVAWTNTGARAHELHASDGLFRTELAPGERFEWRFDAAGVWDVYCPLHDLRSTVRVGNA